MSKRRILVVEDDCALASQYRSALAFAGFDVDVASERKREALSRRLKRGRPEWDTTAPDHADEPLDAAWERERKRRGLA